MAKEKQEEQNQKELEIRKEATEKVIAFFRLGTLLFGQPEPPYNINELKEDNEFYKPAKDLAEELEIDWKKMTHEESNRIMLHFWTITSTLSTWTVTTSSPCKSPPNRKRRSSHGYKCRTVHAET